jgi:hypothetical protein
MELETLAEHLEECLTFRQLRKLALRNKLKQYSYLGKKELAHLLALNSFNKQRRTDAISNSRQQ